ncbi:MAG: arylamine N-acetyltransferase [Alphaproteobacteria bacterium]|nr:arylamine N-acetyltransferase [Alphaproteobacteria bacterium]
MNNAKLPSDALDAYFSRLELAREGLAPDYSTLCRVHRAHALRVPYENLDVQLSRPVTTNPLHALTKIGSGRGGWCYEMNGSLGAALQALGFSVVRMAGGVHRASQGDQMIGNHLILKTEIAGRPYLCDVGFGDGLLEPVPLAEGVYRQGHMAFRLERLEDGFWRFHNDPDGAAPSFDFEDAPADERLLGEVCTFLQTSPESPFVQNAVIQRHFPDPHLSLRGKVLRRRNGDGVHDQALESAKDYIEVLAAEFGLDLPEAASLWPQIEQRHEAVFGGD